MRIAGLGVLLVATAACSTGDAPGQRCDPATFAPRCAPGGDQRLCPEPAFGALLRIPRVTSVPCFSGNVCLVDGRSIGCVSPERERCAEPERRRCAAGQQQVCRPLFFASGAASAYWQAIGIRCDQ